MSAWHHIHQEVRGEGQAFFNSLDQPAQYQQQILNRILQANKHSGFGQQYDFHTISTISAFQQQVPFHSYEQLADYIYSISQGEPRVLTTDPVRVFEQTGGSSGGSKLIPYTQAGLQGFQRALYPWMYDLLSKRPGIMHGSAYWSISPAMRSHQVNKAGIPLGLASDAGYFGPALAEYILQTLAVPPELGAVPGLASWQYLTLWHLLADRELSFISVWSPTFLLDLLEVAQEQAERLYHDLQNNQVSISIPEHLQQILPALPQVSNKRLAELKAVFANGKLDTQLLWPQLDTISCWLDATSARYTQQLTALFPDVYLQGKGLLATEGVISIPVCGEDGGVLTITSGFYEFIDQHEQIYLAHELKEGEIYRVLITNESGLYRYDLGDQVTVTGHIKKTPLLKFTGRVGAVNDLCGEKLAESFVMKQLVDITGPVMLIPCVNGKLGYILLVEESVYSIQQAQSLSQDIEQRLCRNPQYAYARKLGQLSSLTPLRVHNLRQRHTNYQCDKGRCLGDIKPTVFDTDNELYAYFTQQETSLKVGEA